MSDLTIRRLGYALGAEIIGLDVSKPLAQDVVDGVRQAWLDHIVVCIRGQNLNAAELAAFCAQFGPLIDYRGLSLPLVQPDVTEVQVLANKAVEDTKRYLIADNWHSDVDFTTRPRTIVFLHPKELPEIGGDTMFANMYMAYDTLSPKLKELLDPLEAVHVSEETGRSAEVHKQIQRSVPKQGAVHRVVRTHPETGRKALYLGPRVRMFVGMTEDESKPLIDFLNDHAVRYEFIYRHRWSLGDLVFWDNRPSMHFAVRDYDLDQLRYMMRCSLVSPESGYEYQTSAVSA